MANTIEVAVVSDVRRARAGIEDVNKRLGGLSRAAKVTAGVIGATLGARKAWDFGKKIVNEASAAQQSLGATESVFKKYAGTVITRSNQAAAAVGLSANEYRELATVTGAMLKNSGMPLDVVAKKTDTLTKRAADLSATYGGSTREAIEAVNSLLRGEADPIERYGISIKQSDVNARLAAQGLDKLTGSAKKQAEQQARLDLLFKQSGDAAGQFARESNTIANVNQRNSAAWANIKATLGAGLTPALTTLGNVVGTQVLPPLAALADKYAPKVGAELGDLAERIGPKIGKTLAAIGPAIEKIGQGDGGANLDKLSKAGGDAVTVVQSLGAALPSLNNVLTVAGTVLSVAAEHTDVLAAALPYLAAGYVAVKAAQAAAQVAAVAAVPVRVAEVVVNRQLVASNRALIASRAGLTTATVTGTAAETASTASRARSLVGLVAHKAATVAIAAATRSYAAVQWVLNAALIANPIGLVVLAIAALVAGIVIAWKRSETFRKIVTGAFQAISRVVTAVVGSVVGFVRKHWRTLLVILTGPIGIAVALLVKHWSKITATFKAGVAKVTGLVGTIKAKVLGAVAGAGEWLLTVGKNIIDGLGRGIDSGLDWVRSKVEGLGNMIPGWLKRVLGIHSPSRVMAQLGVYIAQGIAVGIGQGTGTVEKRIEVLTNGMTKMFRQIGRHAGLRGADLDTFVKRAMRSNRDFVASTRAGLTYYGRLIDNVNAKLDAQRTRVEDLKKSAADYASSVRDGVLSFANITAVGQLEDGQTAGSIVQGLRDRLNAVQNYTTKLNALLKKGLNKTTYDQLVQAGVEGGTATVEALTAGGGGVVTEVNKLQAKINTAATTLGAQTSSTMHAAGIRAAQGLLRGLESQQAALVRQATRYANAIARAVKKALKIKSPSRVFTEIGEHITRGLVIGLDERVTGRAGKVLAGSLVRGFASPQLQADAVAGGPGGHHVTYNITVQLDSSMTEVEMGVAYKRAIRAAERVGL